MAYNFSNTLVTVLSATRLARRAGRSYRLTACDASVTSAGRMGVWRDAAPTGSPKKGAQLARLGAGSAPGRAQLVQRIRSVRPPPVELEGVAQDEGCFRAMLGVGHSGEQIRTATSCDAFWHLEEPRDARVHAPVARNTDKALGRIGHRLRRCKTSEARIATRRSSLRSRTS
jgi:hypothetical protein